MKRRAWKAFAHGGHYVWWTGWKKDAVGHWAAYPAPMLQQAAGIKNLGLYVCLPSGAEGEYRKGADFDTTVRDPERAFTSRSSAQRISAARERLLHLIDDRIRQWPVSGEDVTRATSWLLTERLERA